MAQLAGYKDISHLLQDESMMRRLTCKRRGKNHFFPLSDWLCDEHGEVLVDFVLRQVGMKHLQLA